MRQEIESGQREGAQATVYVLALAIILMLVAQQAWAEMTRNSGGQSGTISGADGRGVSPRGIPPHAPGYLGILFQDLSEDQTAALHLKGGRGVEVLLVDHDGPAGKAGLQVHDVIVGFNGQPVQSAEVLRRMIHEVGVGANITLAMIRGGREITANTQLAYRGTVEREAMERMAQPGAAPEGDPVVSGFVETYEVESTDPATSHGPGFLAQMLHIGPFTGLVLEAMEPQLAGFFGVPGGGGLLVETVMPDSPASAAGLRAGDVVLRVDSVAVKSTSEWMRRMRASKGQAVQLTVLRDKREATIMLVPQLKKHSELEWLERFDNQPTLA